MTGVQGEVFHTPTILLSGAVSGEEEAEGTLSHGECSKQGSHSNSDRRSPKVTEGLSSCFGKLRMASGARWRPRCSGPKCQGRRGTDRPRAEPKDAMTGVQLDGSRLKLVDER